MRFPTPRRHVGNHGDSRRRFYKRPLWFDSVNLRYELIILGFRQIREIVGFCPVRVINVVIVFWFDRQLRETATTIELQSHNIEFVDGKKGSFPIGYRPIRLSAQPQNTRSFSWFCCDDWSKPEAREDYESEFQMSKQHNGWPSAAARDQHPS